MGFTETSGGGRETGMSVTDLSPGIKSAFHYVVGGVVGGGLSVLCLNPSKEGLVRKSLRGVGSPLSDVGLIGSSGGYSPDEERGGSGSVR